MMYSVTSSWRTPSVSADHSETYVHFEVSALSRVVAGGGETPRTLLDRRRAQRRGDVRGAMLDAARLASPQVGAVWILSGDTAVRDSQLLDEQLLGRSWGSDWGSPGDGCVAADRVPAAGQSGACLRDWLSHFGQ